MRRCSSVVSVCAAAAALTIGAPACLSDSPRVDATHGTAAGGARTDGVEVRGGVGAAGARAALAEPTAGASDYGSEHGATGGSATATGGGGAPGHGGPPISLPGTAGVGGNPTGSEAGADAGVPDGGASSFAGASTSGPGGGAAGAADGGAPDGSSVDGGTAGASEAAPGACGDGVVSGAEECDLGASNQRRAAFTLVHAGARWSVRPLRTNSDAVHFYRYADPVHWSGSTGLEAVDTVWIFLHQDGGTGDVSLVIEAGAATALQARAQLFFDGSGFPGACTVLVSDDAGELGPGPAAGSFTARWSFQRHTDGGVIGGCGFGPGVDASIAFRIDALGSLSRFFWLDGSGHRIALDPASSVGLVTAGTPASCRADCTLPRCGDGVLDGGESCDDAADPPCPAACRW